ncbi:putative disease resistance protein RGA4 isoform X1 [Cornus florida]|uniref:putative disease resistance protein RGA4 isoform X1 n=1 Tax=Cornus florida TaxID=4283 RepID=UPI00289BBBD6|nr:putative disease resistance protein RGA4 isoform X1 [Cornus florida]XP_059651986.1 putative disease resistance protein RGA4 isoform X1 [Cornus florida]XP_059651987.1 putative disease resistance protein RGA4 isoform X1 [Cornus florida]XP_059651988.1 putative disease resistance protein RGA4 isoform X1 [Cornus florida]
MWIANGFIPLLHENQQLEDVGDLYFMDLLRRSLFQDVQRDERGDIRWCKMHDLIHDVAQLVTRFEYSNSDTKNVTERTRHVSFAYYISTQLVRGNKLRTLILKDQRLEKKDFKRIVSTHKCLRLLDLPNMKIKTVPNYISKLKHLRYLDLSSYLIKYLPSSITKLQNLQTLKLNSCHCLKELPRDFKKLVNLNHVELDECLDLIGMPVGLGQLRSLLTLTRFVADLNSSGLSELQNLNNLRGRLSIKMFGRPRGHSCSNSRWWCLKDATAAEGVTNYLEAKQYLKMLVLQFDRDEDNGVLLESLRPHPNLKELGIDRYGGVSFQPSWMMVDKIGLFSSFLPNLVRINMSNCHSKHLPLFGQLPSLQFLRLLFMNSLEYMEDKSSSEDSLCSSSSSSGGGAPTPTFFPSLKTLDLWKLPKLKGWWRSQAEEEATTTLQDQQQQHLNKLPSFPSLSQLSIRWCPNLASMPILQPCLEQLDLHEVSK